MELVDVYGFGHVLYEMVYGQPLLTASSRQEFNDCPDREVRALLETILLTDVLNKNGPPTINQLLELPYDAYCPFNQFLTKIIYIYCALLCRMRVNRFFKDTNVDWLPTSSTTAAASTTTASNSNSKLFTSTKVKETLLKAREFSEKRMNEEQKFVSL